MLVFPSSGERQERAVTGTGRPITTSAAVGKHSTHASLIRYKLAVPRCSACTNPTSARRFRCADTVDRPTSTHATIRPTVIGTPLRASSDTICTRVPSASAANQDAYSRRYPVQRPPIIHR